MELQERQTDSCRSLELNTSNRNELRGKQRETGKKFPSKFLILTGTAVDHGAIKIRKKHYNWDDNLSQKIHLRQIN